ncbi:MULTISPECIES: hypothetical protein [unclassified Pseudoalteromonas]|uniref:hypothetical protein n=1 Tax=unclassified Pseudoalteromonas TaxID=194690 RepID=UPI000EBE3CE1|nr:MULTISPECIES: hypothetical protein [unclassified Pseudoalteromonas]HAG39824.1 hypothetical protein [Pseudoalteromonas sp.]|tara:strand:+ start:3000 stop:4394 length:1395 start_codon:yes stop_codon:yes gene_type:complete
MRFLILLVALTSAFFVSADELRLPDLTDLRPPNTTEDFCSKTSQIHGYTGVGCSAVSAFESNRASCEDLADKIIKPDFGQSINYQFECYFSPNSYNFRINETYQKYSVQAGQYVTYEGSSYILNFAPQQPQFTFECPPDGYRNHIVKIDKVPVPDDPSVPPFDCAKIISSYDNDCPPANDNDPFAFSFRPGIHTVCYNVASGRQCEILTDKNGGYYFPHSFGSREPDECSSESDGDPTDPDDTDPTEPDETDPTETAEPDEKPEAEELDTEAKTELIDGINTINTNLSAMNTNQISASNSNDDRLDRLAGEIQISNNYLSEIATGSPNSGGSIDNQALAEIAANTKQTAENTEPLDFGISANRKNKGLSSVFVNSKINELKEEVEAKNLEFENYLAQIQDESKVLFSLNPNITASYQERLETIKGVEVDLGLSRFSNFFQLIAPAILLAASITALFILLGGNKE